MTEDKPLRIVIADDHSVVRRGLRQVLEADTGLEVVAEAEDIDGARRYVRGHQPDVLVLDLNMPGGSTLDAIPEIRAEAPDTQIVVLTMQNEPAYARAGAQRRGDGLRAQGGGRVGAGRGGPAAAAGDTYLNPRLGARVAAEPPPGPPGRSLGARGRGAADDRARAHQRRDRRAALPVGPHRRDAPRAHPAEAPARLAIRARALRARSRPRDYRQLSAAESRGAPLSPHRLVLGRQRTLERLCRVKRVESGAVIPPAGVERGKEERELEGIAILGLRHGGTRHRRTVGQRRARNKPWTGRRQIRREVAPGDLGRWPPQRLSGGRGRIAR